MKCLFLLSLLVMLTSCSGGHVKTSPEHKGVDKELVPYQEEFFEMAAENGIYFKKRVSMGFKSLKGSTIGTCTYNLFFREIDIDPSYWNRATEMKKRALVFHELIHCYCTRYHTYGDKAQYTYPKGLISETLHKIKTLYSKEDNGYLEDGCPKSIMYPTVLSERCMWKNYDYYMKEMFNRCRRW